MARDEFMNRYGLSKRKPPRVPRTEKLAQIHAAEQNLPAWELTTVPKPPKSKPRSVVQINVPSYTPPSLKRSNRFEDLRYKAALAAPVNATINVNGKKRSARRFLAETMTPERRQELTPSVPASRDSSLLHAITSTPGSILHNWGIGARVARDVATAPLKSLAQTAIETAYGAQRPSTPFTPPRPPASIAAPAAGARTALHGASEFYLGPELTKLTEANTDVSLPWLAADVALLGVFPPFKLAKGVTSALRAGRTGGRDAARIAFDSAMDGAAPAAAYSSAVRSKVLKGPERDQAHTSIDQLMGEYPEVAAQTKKDIDAHVLIATRKVPAKERAAAAQAEYAQLAKDISEGQPTARARKPFEAPEGRPDEAVTLPDTDTLRKVAFDGVDLSVFRKHNIDDFLEKIPEYLRRGAKYRHWYEDSGRAILKLANGDRELAARFAQVVAIYSASRRPVENINLALQAIHEWDTTGKITVNQIKDWRGKGTGKRKPRDQADKAMMVMRGEDWGGRKTNRFYANMLETIDPVRHAREFPGGEVTNDIWMARLFGLKTEVPTPREYEQMTRIQQNIAAALGWEPKHIQAALWVPAKADAGRTITGPGGKKIRTSLEDSEAGIDFAEALRQESAYVPIEAAPGRRVAGQEFLRRYDQLNPEQQQDYLREKSDVVRQYLGESKVLGRLWTEGVGVYENGANPAFTIQIPVGVAREGPLAWSSPESKRVINRVISDIGWALNQDAMAWFRPVYRREPASKQNGVWLQLSRPLTEDETLRLSRDLKAATGGDIAVPPAAGNDIYVLNYSKAKNTAFHDHVETAVRAIGEAGDDLDVEQVPFRFDGELRTRSKYLGQRQRNEAGAEAGRSDVREPAHRLRARSDEIDRRYLGGGGGAEGVPAPLPRGEGRPHGSPASLRLAPNEPLEGLPPRRPVGGDPIPTRPAPDVRRLAEQYSERSGIPHDPPAAYREVDEKRAKRIAKAYDAMRDLNDPRATPAYRKQVLRAYQAMADETAAQYELLEQAGYRFEFYPRDADGTFHDPYGGNPWGAMADLRDNKHMYVFPTEAGFGTEAAAAIGNPLLVDSGVRWGGQAVTVNDLFRAVHDVFGHYKEGVGFRAHGEENAWRSHSAMYSEQARRAMTSETRGQNSWVNYGPHAEKNRTADQLETVYAEQKAGIMPDWVVNEGATDAKRVIEPAESLAAKSTGPAGTPAIDESMVTPEQQARSDEGLSLLDEGGFISPGAFIPERQYTPRQISYEGMTQNIRQARTYGPVGRVTTRQGERLVDWASSQLQKSEFFQHKGLQAVTVSGRVAKYAGRKVGIESERALAKMRRHLDAIGQIKEGSDLDAATFWYAQLPADYRNADGLTLVRDAQIAHRDSLLDGSFRKEIENRILAARIEARQLNVARGAAQLGDPDEVHLIDVRLNQLKNEVDRQKMLIADIPWATKDVLLSIERLEKLIAQPPAVEQRAIDAVDALARDREQILVDAGKLDAGVADSRRALVADWLGLEPSGEEVYVGHRMANPENFPGPPRQVPLAVGRVRPPAGTSRPNRLLLASGGRIRPSLRVAAEDWQSAQVFRQANQARDDLSRMGTEYKGGHIPEDMVLVNAKGRTIPRAWKSDEMAQFADLDDRENIREQANQILEGFIAKDPATQHAMAAEQPYEDLRLVPRRLVERYYAQFRSESRTAGGVFWDQAVDAMATSIVFARIGYIPKNIAQNLIMSMPHQGAFLPYNLVKAAQLRVKEPELWNMLAGEVAFSGATRALAAKSPGIGRVTEPIRNFVGGTADDMFRVAAFIHEMGGERVINPYNLRPTITAKEKQRIADLFKPRNSDKLDDMRSRANESMADFSRLTPQQSRWARRFFIVPSWLIAGSRYPFRFAADHPVRTALIAYVAAGEPGAPDELQFNQSVDHYLHGSRWLEGINTPWGRLRTGSISPVSTPYEIGAATIGLKDAGTVGDYLNPLAVTVVDMLRGEIRYPGGSYHGGYSKAIPKGLERLTPGVGFVRNMVNPDEAPYYPEDVTRLGRLKRELGVVPISVPEELRPHPGRKRALLPTRGGYSSGSIYGGGGSGGYSEGSIFGR